MRRALELAAGGMLTTKANPRVGCVLVQHGRIVGEGFHVRPGDGHAEVNALAAAPADITGATVYVTLEPCAHHGRTPPCAQALITAGVARVVIAGIDPNPKVDGGGIKLLRAAGIEVQTGLLETSARALNPGFLARLERGAPWLRVKVAASLDGCTALADGESKWITSAHARADVQQWRARACAILSGADTVLVDDPALTVRVDSRAQTCDESASDLAQPLRVVIDGRLRVPATARTFSLPGACLVACTEAADRGREQALIAHGVEVLRLPAQDNRIDLGALLQALAAREINEIHTEAGPRLVGALLSAGLVDEIIWYTAPLLLGAGAQPAAALGPFASMQERLEFSLHELTQIGPDIRLTLRPSLSADL